MSTLQQIVAGGGWKGVRVVRIKAKAWLVLFAAVGFGCLSTASLGTIWFHAWVPASFSLIVSVALFIRERSVEFRWFRGRVGRERGKLYGSFGSGDCGTGDEGSRISGVVPMIERFDSDREPEIK